MTTKREERTVDLATIMWELEISRKDTLFSILFDFYIAAGFREETLSEELCGMSENELLEAYLNI